MKIKSRTRNPLRKRARKGFRGYPLGTIAFYGPDDERASKVAVGIVIHEGAEPDLLKRWYAAAGEDLRSDEETTREISVFFGAHDVISVVMPDRIIGCPYEEGVDYPDGSVCPQCPFWRNRDRAKLMLATSLS